MALMDDTYYVLKCGRLHRTDFEGRRVYAHQGKNIIPGSHVRMFRKTCLELYGIEKLGWTMEQVKLVLSLGSKAMCDPRVSDQAVILLDGLI